VLKLPFDIFCMVDTQISLFGHNYWLIFVVKVMQNYVHYRN